MRTATLLYLLAFSFCIARDAESNDQYLLRSPNGEVEFVLTSDGSTLKYMVRLAGKSVVDKSVLDMQVDGRQIATGPLPQEAHRSAIQESYRWHGGRDYALHAGNAATLTCVNEDGGPACQIDVRAYDDGVAYRWVVPSGGDAARVPAETSEYRLPPGSTVWFHDMRGHYEGVHRSALIEDLTEGTWAAPPVTFKLPDGRGYASITEAALENYSGMSLQATGRGAWRTVLGPAHPVSRPFQIRYEEDIEPMSEPAAITGTITTPWRVVMVCLFPKQQIENQ